MVGNKPPQRGMVQGKTLHRRVVKGGGGQTITKGNGLGANHSKGEWLRGIANHSKGEWFKGKPFKRGVVWGKSFSRGMACGANHS